MKKVCNIWAIAYILILLTAIPLYVERNYFNLLEAKRHCFILISAVMIPIGIILFIIGHRKDELKTIGRFPLDIPVMAFAFVSLISCLLSGDVKSSFFGTLGWGIGAYTWLMLALSYILISRCLVYNQNIWLVIMAVNIVIIIFAILHAASVDVFSMHKGVIGWAIFDYYSTVGQMNWWVGYLSLLMPITAVFFMEGKKTYSRIIYYVFWFFLCMAAVIIASDGIFVGFGFCAFFAVPYIMKKRERIGDFGWLIAAFGACVLIISLLPCFKLRINSIGKGLSVYITRTLPGVLFLVAGLFLGVLCTFLIKSYSKTASRLLTLIIEIALAAVVVFFLVKTIKGFNEDWGSRRGLIWKMSALLWESFSPKEKIIGIGPEMLRWGYRELSARFGMTVLVSHSEPLQYLLTTGIAGLICWLGIWISSAVTYFRECKRGFESPAFFLAMMAFFGQSFVNSAMTTNLVMLFIVMALFCRNMTDHQKMRIR